MINVSPSLPDIRACIHKAVARKGSITDDANMIMMSATLPYGTAVDSQGLDWMILYSDAHGACFYLAYHVQYIAHWLAHGTQEARESAI